ncbi:uncharacterized protein PAC_19153 [Phialocephala subalpina]|uniref:Uncharacterized protein n=1 Tax=Phialocephala subalpina TaxID=576137 RepID=A0A1L7XW38_9HELO|nr:uncharacterized protein PAC_19153 [Phialocephala subalpina]
MNKNGFVKEASAYTSIDKTYEWLSMPKNKVCVPESLGFDLGEILIAPQDHNAEWKVEEQEILDQLYKGWLQYWNHESINDAVNGMAGARRFYDFDQMLSYDMFGNTPRGRFGEHFDAIFPYWGDGQMDFKDIEITCLSKDSAFSTM